MRIAIDAMGGDFAPREIVLGSINRARKFSEEQILLVGQREPIDDLLRDHGGCPKNLTVVPAAEVIGMDEHPANAVKAKKDSSLVVANRLVKQKEADAVLSMGSTGACLAASMFLIGRHHGVTRPAVACIFPTFKGGVVLLDMGTNIDCDPAQLQQFAHMGSFYAEFGLKRQRPLVTLLNIGSEEIKGGKILTETHQLLKADPTIRFGGNIEGTEIFSSEADVIVCDGLLGNVLLKSTEGLSHALMGLFKKAFEELKVEKEKQKAIFQTVQAFSASAPQYSCAPLLGLDGVSIIGHGNSNHQKVFDAIGVTGSVVASGMVGKMGEDPRFKKKASKV